MELERKNPIDISGQSKKDTIADIEAFADSIGEIDGISGESGVMETQEGKMERIVKEISLTAKQKFENQSMIAMQNNNKQNIVQAQKKVALVDEVVKSNEDHIKQIFEKRGEDDAVTFVVSSVEQLSQ